MKSATFLIFSQLYTRHSIGMYLLSIDVIVGAGLGSGDLLVNRTAAVPVLMEDFHRVYVPEEDICIKQ